MNTIEIENKESTVDLVARRSAQRDANVIEHKEMVEYLMSEPRVNAPDFHIVLISLYYYGSIPVHTLGSLLRSKGYKVSYIFFKDYMADGMGLPTDQEYHELTKTLDRLQPDLVGLSLMSTFAPVARQITKLIHKLDIPLVWGGSHPVSEAEDSIKYSDIVCVGEGEYPILKLAEALSRGSDYTKIQGLWTSRNDVITRNGLNPLLQNLDLIPPPEFGDDDKYYIENNQLYYGEPHFTSDLSWYNFMSGRGCPYSCTFCINSFLNERFKGKGNLLRRRSVDNVIEELVKARDQFPKLSKISANDEVFALGKDWLYEFCSKYKKEINIPFHSDLFPSRIDDETIKLLSSIKMKTVSIGIQSGCEQTRKDLYKRRTPDKMLINAANIFKKYKVFPSYDFIFDNPLESYNELEQTLHFILKLPRPFRINAYSMQHHPSTALTQTLLKEGVISDDDVDGATLKGMDHWHVNMWHHSKNEDLYYIHALVKIYSCTVAIATPYFSVMYAIYPKWFFRLLVNNPAILKRNPYVLSTLLVVGNVISNIGRGLSALLSGRWKTIYHRYFSGHKATRQRYTSTKERIYQ